MAELNQRQEMFCREYIKDLNGTQAAIRAGYSEKTAASIGQENLIKPEIQAEIQKLMDVRSNKVEVTADRVLQELKVMAFYDAADIAGVPMNCPADIVKLPEDVRRCIIGWGWDKAGNFTLKLASKTQQLELIGRHLKMFTDKTEHTGMDGSPLIAGATILSPEQMEQIERIKARRESAAEQRA